MFSMPCSAQVPGLSDPTQVRTILTNWPVAADHIMCVSPHEPALFQFSECPTSFVGHPAMQKVMKQQQQAHVPPRSKQQRSPPSKAAAHQPWFESDKLRQPPNVWKWDGVFAEGSASRFWAQHGSQLSRLSPADGKAAKGASSSSSNNSSSSSGSSSSSSKRRPLVALFPGRLERDMAQLMEPLGERATWGTRQREPWEGKRGGLGGDCRWVLTSDSTTSGQTNTACSTAACMRVEAAAPVS
jgi:hypothetical protein